MPSPSGGANSGLVALTAFAQRIGGPAESRRNLKARDVEGDEEEDRILRHGGDVVPKRATVSYGGPKWFSGYMAPYEGRILAITAILKSSIRSGQVSFFFRVNGANHEVETLTFSSSDEISKRLELTTPLDVSAGDMIEIGIKETRFVGDFATTESVSPGYNTAGITIMMQL